MASRTQRASATMFESRNSLGEDVRAQMVELLNQQLADTLDLYTQAKQAHWNVKGRDFFQLHELFDTLADTLPAHIDEIAERVTALGGKACGTVRMSAASSRLEEFPSDLREGMDFVATLADRYASYGATVREGIDTAQDAGDADTADLLTDISREIDKHLYFLESHLQA
jgi:starvation-inducible DNA-binding protein